MPDRQVPLPEHLESRLLAILDRPDAEQDRAIEDLLAPFPQHREHIQRLVQLARQTTSGTGTDATNSPLPAIPGYRVLERLGRGGMGEVFLAEHERLQRRVALKVIRTDLLGVAGARERFDREARVASRLDHPGICKVWEVGEHDGRPFLAMQWIRGRTLAETILRQRDAEPAAGRGGRATLDAAILLVERLARALHVAHEAGLVHRDVKPGNVMVRDDGEPVLLDFGLARDLADDGNATASQDLIGTPRYMAPEQVQPRGRRADRRTDVYALGVVGYELLTLRPAFLAHERTELFAAIVRGEWVAPRRLLPAMPRELEVVIECAMDREPERRYPTALALAEDLRRVREHEPILARPMGALLRLRRWQQRHPVRSVAAAMAGALVVVVAVFWNHTRGLEAALREQGTVAAVRAGESAMMFGSFKEALAALERARSSESVELTGLQLARIEAHEGLFQIDQARAQVATLLQRSDHGLQVARVELRVGQEEMAKDVDTGRARIRHALELHEHAVEQAHQPLLLPVEVELARAWLSDDLDAVIAHLRAGLEAQPGHVSTLSLLLPALLFRGRATEVLQVIEREQVRLAPSFLVLPRLLAKVMLGRKAEAEALRAEVRALLGQPIDELIDPIVQLLLMMQEQLSETTERLVGSLSSQAVSPRGNAMVKAMASLGKWATLRRNLPATLQLLDGRLLLRGHPSVTGAYARLSVNPLQLVVNPLESLTRTMKATVDAFPDSLCVALYASSFLGNSPLPAAEKFAEAIRWCDLADQGYGLTGQMPPVRRFRAYQRIGSLSTWLGGLAADAPERAGLEQKLTTALDEVIGVEGVTEAEFRTFEIVAATRLGKRRWDSVARIIVAWERAHGATTRLAIGRADWFIATGAKEEARTLLEEVLQQHPDHAEAKNLLALTR